MQIFYEENAVTPELMDKYKVNEMSPALTFAGVTNMEDILNAIAKDEIPTNTQQPFGVVWGIDDSYMDSPDFDDTPSKPNFSGSYPMGFVNPLESLIKL